MDDDETIPGRGKSLLRGHPDQSMVPSSMSEIARRSLPLVEGDVPQPGGGSFQSALEYYGVAPLVRGPVSTLQVNVGKVCNQACHHCHVEAGPNRTESMSREVAERVLELLSQNVGVTTVDITGGAPELNPNFQWLVTEARRLGREVIDRCNLTILSEAGMTGLAEFFAEQQVHVIASLPCYQAENVEAQRGKGVFDRSIEALQRLNTLGFGRPGSNLRLDLVYNPLGASLPPSQGQLEAQYKRELGRAFGVEFHNLLTITNMPIKRFAHQLARTGEYEAYMGLLVNHFNPATVPEVMCRSLVSVGWDGRLYDCDFNQMLEIELGPSGGAKPRTVWELGSLDALVGARIATAAHCFACTAGAGSSCGGTLQ
jgi:radical SAM/Cys-rich protein